MILTRSKFKLVMVCRITAFYGGLAPLNLFYIISGPSVLLIVIIFPQTVRWLIDIYAV